MNIIERLIAWLEWNKRPCEERDLLNDALEELESLTARLAAAEAARPKCKWKPDDPYYETACGHFWQFIDGGVGENDTKFCPFCGGEIELPRCHICGDAECYLDRCADCGKEFCGECGDWCGDPDDDPHGDYFCDECQKDAEP